MVSATSISWTNWSGTYSCRPTRIESPAGDEEIVALVHGAAERGERVKVIGSGHSFTDIGCTDGCLVRLDRHNRVLAVDPEAMTITAEAGITIVQLSEALAEQGMAMENMGDVGYQTISGAISTATHGTGEKLRNISSQVVGLSLVLADGGILDCSEKKDRAAFKAAQVSLGALGVISTVTLRCVPAYNIRSVQQPERLDALLETLDQRCRANDHFEFFWWPHTEWAQAITNTRTQDPPEPSQRRTGFGAYVNDILLENHAFGLVQRAAQLNRAWIPSLAGFTAKTMSRKELTDRSDRIFANQRLVRFAEMEYALPRQHLVQAVRDIRSMIERKGFLIVAALPASALMGIFTIVGFELAADLGEEAIGARITVPKAVLWSVASSAILGMIALIGFTIALPNDFSKIASSATPLVDIVNLWLGTGPAAVFLVLVIFSILALDVVGLAATGRLIFAMARDNILPASTFLRQVNPQTRTPIRALVSASLLGLAFTILGYYITVTGTGKDAFFALVGATSTLPFIVYFLTVLAYVLRRERMASLPEAFNLGTWAKPVMYAALAWSLIALGLLMIPKIYWLTDEIVIVVIVVAAVWYFAVLRGRLARGEAGVEQLPKQAEANPAG